MQGVLGTAVDDALGLDGLLAAEAGALDQHGRVPQALQPGIEPEACDPGADDQHVSGNGRWHAGTSRTGTVAQYTGCGVMLVRGEMQTVLSRSRVNPLTPLQRRTYERRRTGEGGFAR